MRGGVVAVRGAQPQGGWGVCYMLLVLAGVGRLMELGVVQGVCTTPCARIEHDALEGYAVNGAVRKEDGQRVFAAEGHMGAGREAAQLQCMCMCVCVCACMCVCACVRVCMCVRGLSHEWPQHTPAAHQCHCFKPPGWAPTHFSCTPLCTQFPSASYTQPPIPPMAPPAPQVNSMRSRRPDTNREEEREGGVGRGRAQTAPLCMRAEAVTVVTTKRTCEEARQKRARACVLVGGDWGVGNGT
eukprot:1153343-Pelagomonas_calceolata.AAC.6